MLQGFAKHGEYVDFGESWLVYLTQQGGKKILVDGTEVILGYSGSKQVFIKPDSVVQELIRGTKTHTLIGNITRHLKCYRKKITIKLCMMKSTMIVMRL